MRYHTHSLAFHPLLSITMPLKYGLFCAVIVFNLTACESSATQNDDATASDTAATNSEDRGAYGYEAFLFGTVTDTLRGNARFGDVLIQDTGAVVSVIVLEARGGFGGGIYITRGDTVMPQVGTYDLADAAQVEAPEPPGQFVMRYQQGLQRQLASSGGRLTLETVSDTLIEGSFNATLRGLVSGQSVVDVRAQGTFSAEPGSVGYIIGL